MQMGDVSALDEFSLASEGFAVLLQVLLSDAHASLNYLMDLVNGCIFFDRGSGTLGNCQVAAQKELHAKFSVFYFRRNKFFHV